MLGGNCPVGCVWWTLDPGASTSALAFQSSGYLGKREIDGQTEGAKEEGYSRYLVWIFKKATLIQFLSNLTKTTCFVQQRRHNNNWHELLWPNNKLAGKEHSVGT